MTLRVLHQHHQPVPRPISGVEHWPRSKKFSVERRFSHSLVANWLSERSLAVYRMIVRTNGATNEAVAGQPGTPLSPNIAHVPLARAALARVALSLAVRLVVGAAAGTSGWALAAETNADVAAKKLETTNAPAASRNAPGATNATTISPSSTNATAAAAKPLKLDYPAFRMVAERNIFNSERTRRTSRSGGDGGPKPRSVQVSTVSLVGFLGSPQGDRAFFDGSGSTYRKAVKAGESLGDFKVASVTSQGAVLEIGGRKLSLKIGEQLRREEAGAWELNGSRSSTGGSSSSSTNESATAAGDDPTAAAGKDGEGTDSAGADDVLQRLLKKRQLEENK